MGHTGSYSIMEMLCDGCSMVRREMVSQSTGPHHKAVVAFPVLASPSSSGSGTLGDTYWAAAGMTIDAFQMISLHAVAVVMFGQFVKLGIYAVALVDIPNAKSPVKFVHVELGIGVTVDFDYGTMRVEGQLSPKSFILDPNCHLTGGFALFYWFDAFANFLINYKPFHFASSAGICVGVRFNIDVLFIHTHISVEVGADLFMWGPPLAGRVHVDIKVAKFDINFGADKGDEKEANIEEFYHLVLQASSQQSNSRAAEEDRVLIAEGEEDILPGDLNQGHTFLATSGLLNNSSSTDRAQNTDWVAMTKSEMKIEIVQDVPTGLWAKCKSSEPSQDPTKSSQRNNIDDLLDNNSTSLKLMMGVLMEGPPAIMSEDTLKAFNILAQGERVLKAKKPFPETESPEDDWNPGKPKDGAEQWNDVHNKWSSPEWNEGRGDVQQTLVDSCIVRYLFSTWVQFGQNVETGR
ncbi:hypothetical protein IWW34DRAFT_819555 [Fusarium oxysporum f. sp. albedinis]|nr:hypothetical protein IWW34DRAFT_819555 [Fusarium oxysporum f. sp. albedinis]